MSGYGGYPGGGYGGGGYGGPPPPQGYDQYGRPPPPQGYGSYGSPAPPPGQDQYGRPPPPQGYGGYGGSPAPPQQHGYNQYPPPGGPPPPQQGGYGQHPPPSGPRPGGHYGGGGGGGQNRYPPPSYAPPPGLDPYGYPLHPPGGGGYRGVHRAGPPPPTQAQEFGHGAPAEYKFQYSNCTGKRKALLIGINYFGQKGELRGCINDVKNVSSFLKERYNYRSEDMVILTDDQQNPVGQPTRENIIRAIGWLVRDAQPNDSLFLHYSGHGGQTEDLDGDEDDGYDEVIYPVDYEQAGHIVDDELHARVVSPLQAGVRLTAIFDSCHSGSCLDLPYIYSTKGVLKEPNLAAEAGQGLLGALSAYAQGDTGGVAKSFMGFAKTAFKGQKGYKKTMETKTSPADVIMWSGSKDDQTSADATIASKATGAMSYSFLKALRQDPQQSYVELLNSIRDILENEYSQKPQLSCSHPLDTNLLFVM